MRSYVISTDSSADLSEAYLKEHQITMISLSCILNGKIYNSENPITPKQLYDNIREGAMPTTSQVNPMNPIMRISEQLRSILIQLNRTASTEWSLPTSEQEWIRAGTTTTVLRFSPQWLMRSSLTFSIISV